MGAREILRRATAALLGISAYESAPPTIAGPSEAELERIRRARGGQIQPLPLIRTRWYLSDLELAEYQCAGGDLSLAAQLMSAARRDGVLAGVLSTRTAGLVRLPKRFRGDPEIVSALEVGTEYARSVFDEIYPPAELANLAADGELLGVGVGEHVPVEGRDYPAFCRLDPQWLLYRWQEARWYYRSTAGLVPITPGDGRWVLHTPGGRSAPWASGLWRCVGRAYIRKEHASRYKDEWEAKLANPARVAYAPGGSVERERDNFFSQVAAWGVNSVFSLLPGYEVKLLESNGRGYESFQQTIADQNQEFTIAIAGQTVTTDGGTGFANADIHKSIRADLIKATADSLAYTLNTQGIPAFVLARYGEDALARCPIVEWDVTPPKDRTTEANALSVVAQAISALRDALAAHGRALDIDDVCMRFGVPLLDADADGRPDEIEDDDTELEDDDELEREAA